MDKDISEKLIDSCVCERAEIVVEIDKEIL